MSPLSHWQHYMALPLTEKGPPERVKANKQKGSSRNFADRNYFSKNVRNGDL